MISIVIELENNKDAEILSEGIIKQLCQQSVAIESCEIILVARNAHKKAKDLFQKYFPHIKILNVDDTVQYGQMKLYGARIATSEIIAFLDSDCIPSSKWIEEIVNAFKAATDKILIIQGRTVYQDKPGANYYTYHLLGKTWVYNDMLPGDIVLNNLAVKKTCVDLFPFADKPARQGTECYMTTRLRRAGYQIQIAPKMNVIHYYQSGATRWFVRGQRAAWDKAEAFHSIYPMLYPQWLVKLKTFFPILLLTYWYWSLQSLAFTLQGSRKLNLNNTSLFSTIQAYFFDTLGGLYGMLVWTLKLDEPVADF